MEEQGHCTQVVKLCSLHVPPQQCGFLIAKNAYSCSLMEEWACLSKFETYPHLNPQASWVRPQGFQPLDIQNPLVFLGVGPSSSPFTTENPGQPRGYMTPLVFLDCSASTWAPELAEHVWGEPYTRKHTNIQALTAAWGQQSLHSSLLGEHSFLMVAESIFLQPLITRRVSGTQCPSQGWFPFMVHSHSAAHKGLWNPFSWGMLLHTHKPMALCITVPQMVFFILKSFHLMFVIHVAKYNPAVSHQHSLLMLLRTRQTQEERTELQHPRDWATHVQQCCLWAASTQPPFWQSSPPVQIGFGSHC